MVEINQVYDSEQPVLNLQKRDLTEKVKKLLKKAEKGNQNYEEVWVPGFEAITYSIPLNYLAQHQIYNQTISFVFSFEHKV